MKTTRRRSPSLLPVLTAWALLLFAAGMLTGWTAASVRGLSPAAPNTLTSLPANPEEPFVLIQPEEPSIEPEECFSPGADGWNLILVNASHPLPEDFAPPELTQLRNGQAIDRRAYPALQRMMDDARAAGLDPLICSSYRTEATQRRLFEKKVQSWLDQGYIQEEAGRKAAERVARPGTSEHQLGLAVDIVDKSYQILDEAQERTAVQSWLMTHCADYGFILRYPTDKSAVTGVGYEPWHYRYVGEEAARIIMENGLCLEEYLESL